MNSKSEKQSKKKKKSLFTLRKSIDSKTFVVKTNKHIYVELPQAFQFEQHQPSVCHIEK